MEGVERRPVTHTLTTREGAVIRVHNVLALVDPEGGLTTYERPVHRRLNALLRDALGRNPEPGSVVELDFGDAPAVVAEPVEPNPVSLEVKRAIWESGLTKAEVARRMGVRPPMVSQWTNPRYRGHGVETLRRLAEALGAELEVHLRAPPRPEGQDAA